MEAVVCGRVIGNASNFWHIDDFEIQFVDFVPANGVTIPKADFLGVNYSSGRITIWEGEGVDCRMTYDVDLVDCLQGKVSKKKYCFVFW